MMRLSYSLPIVMSLAVMEVATAQEWEALGRLFYTPAGRQALDRQRASLSHGPRLPLAGESLRIDGVVMRSEGRHTIWINGVGHTEDQAHLATRAVRTSPRRFGKVLIMNGEAGPIEMSIGSRYDPNTGKVQDLLGEGKIETVKK
ncbi:MAG: hypothetical protein N2441_04110 [Rhodocyclaceae bacterium]|nr:hypothetical protein [Rhodocyclaceae bacterium]